MTTYKPQNNNMNSRHKSDVFIVTFCIITGKFLEIRTIYRHVREYEITIQFVIVLLLVFSNHVGLFF